MTHDPAEMAARNNAAWCDAVCRAHGVPGEFALRISQGRSDDGQTPTYLLRFSAAPGPDDVVVELPPLRVFIDPEAVGPLDDAVLDAEETASGHRLVFRPAA